MGRAGKILVFLTLSAFFLLGVETLRFFHWLYELNLIFFVVVFAVFLWFSGAYLFVPLLSILLMPSFPGPKLRAAEETAQRARAQEERILRRRLKLLGPVVGEEIPTDLDALRSHYENRLPGVRAEAEGVRRKRVREVFYATALSQNGFVDALVILASALRLSREIFSLYGGRPGPRDLWNIGKHVYFSILVGGSEISEYIIEELVNTFARGLPFVDKAAGSLADGAVNGMLLIRVSLITEKYCSLTLLDDSKSLYPSHGELYAVFSRYSRDYASDLARGLKGAAAKKGREKIGKLKGSVQAGKLKGSGPVGKLFRRTTEEED